MNYYIYFWNEEFLQETAARRENLWKDLGRFHGSWMHQKKGSCRNQLLGGQTSAKIFLDDLGGPRMHQTNCNNSIFFGKISFYSTHRIGWMTKRRKNKLLGNMKSWPMKWSAAKIHQLLSLNVKFELSIRFMVLLRMHMLK